MSADDHTGKAEEASERDLLLNSLDEQAEAQIRRVWHEDRYEAPLSYRLDLA